MFGKEPTIIFGGHEYTVNQFMQKYIDLATKYNQLHDQYEALEQQCRQLKQLASQGNNQPFAGAGERTAANVQPTVDTTIYVSPTESGPVDNAHLISRYYTLAQSSMPQYRSQIEQLQHQLDALLKDTGHTEFLKLVKMELSAGDYRQQITKRNDQLVSYVDSHPTQVKMVNNGKTFERDDEERGIKYWKLFIAYYRKQLELLLKNNQQMRANFRFALKDGKSDAINIRDQKPSFLSDNGRLRLGTIDAVIKDREQWEKQMKKFQNGLGNFLQGVRGEQRVRKVVSEGQNRILSSLNLPFSYDGKKRNSNQIDSIVVNRQGIFILEIKNYKAAELGINADGTLYGKWGRSFRRYDSNIVQQGEYHREAVEQALNSDPLTKAHFRYLAKNIHVLYVSANVQTKRRAAPQGHPDYQFVGLEGLMEAIQQAGGNLHPEIVDQVCDALTNAQQEEKPYPQFLFPSDPDHIMDNAWQQLQVIEQLNNTKLDDLVKAKDSMLFQSLDQAGLKSCDGFVTHKPRHKK